MPGRSVRASESINYDLPFETLRICDEIQTIAASAIVLFGHSFGAAVAFKVALEMKQRGRAVSAIILSSLGPSPGAMTAVSLIEDSQQFMGRVNDLFGGIPAEILESHEGCAYYAALIKADLRACSNLLSVLPSDKSLVTVLFRGRDDPVVSKVEMFEWEGYSTVCNYEEFAGGHFYFSNDVNAVAAKVKAIAETSCRLHSSP